MNATPKPVVGVDTAKSVFQLYSVDMETGEVIRKQLKRAQFLQCDPDRDYERRLGLSHAGMA